MKTTQQVIEGFQIFKDKAFVDKKQITSLEITQLQIEYMQKILQEFYDKGHEDGYTLQPKRKIN